MVPVLVPFKLMFDSHALYPRWPPLLKIEMPSNGQNCFILRQNVPKFELYKHNDWLIYYVIFYDLWTFIDFDRLCKLEKGGDEIFKKSLKLLSQSQPNCWNDSWVVLFQNCVRHFRTPTKMAAVTKNRNFFNCPLLL